MSELHVDFPEKLLPLLFGSAPYKVAHGGRGSAKSWSFARGLLLHGVNKPLRILCAREIQKSIKDSVHQLLKDQVTALGLEAVYEAKETEIVSRRNSSRFLFVGLSDLTADSIKSYEGIDICWVEEAHTITDRSWKILIPTIRKDGSEIWISFNPQLETDPTYVRFVIDPPEGTIVVSMNWRDNPFWNQNLEAKRLEDKQKLPKAEYDNIWEGECLPAVEGAIFFEEISQMEREGRICNVPYDPMLRVHIVVDLGVGGNMALSLIQKHTSEVRIINYLSGDEYPTIAHYSAALRQDFPRYNWGKVWLPFADGFSRDLKTGKGADQIFRELGWLVANKGEVGNSDVEGGIRQARLVAPRVYIDKTHCVDYVASLKRYRRRINKQTMTATTPLPDDHAHAGDNFRYIAINIDRMTNDVDRKPVPYVQSYGALDEAVGY